MSRLSIGDEVRAEKVVTGDGLSRVIFGEITEIRRENYEHLADEPFAVVDDEHPVRLSRISLTGECA